MNEDVKNFIERNIDFIEHQDWEAVYIDSYHTLSEQQCIELTDILRETFKRDFDKIRLSVAVREVELELVNMINDNKKFISFPSFIRMYMNHLLGINPDVVRAHLINNPVRNKGVKQRVDSSGELFFNVL